MNTFFKTEVLLAILIIVTLFLLANPIDLWMPNTITMMILFAFSVLLVIFSVFVWREKAGDEREKLHQLMADRLAFLVGSALLTAGIIYQEIQTHEVDTWLLVILAAMVITKTIGLLYSQKNY